MGKRLDKILNDIEKTEKKKKAVNREYYSLRSILGND